MKFPGHTCFVGTALFLVAFPFSCDRENKGTDLRAVIGEITTQSGVEMVALAGGTFTMGRDRDSGDESPAHSVTLSPFLIDKYEVMQEHYERLMTANPAHFKGPRNPVEQVRWSDAVDYCNARSREEGLDPAYDQVTFDCNFESNGYRLPTEAEWEFACHAGTDTDFCFGSDPGKLRSYALFADNSGNKTHPAGSLKSNAWGLFDMHGNVSEWCHDCYAADYYRSSPRENPRGPSEGKNRVLRGGSWASSAESNRATYRMFDNPGITDACFAKDTYGFRCVRRLSDAERATLLEKSHP
ncbi:MAG: SUMF1/EgtB/PvdO family nonheme iron enzyme [bacterium]